MRLLVIDDDEMTLELLTAVLEEAGYLTLAAANAIDASHLLHQWPDIGLVVCDLHMPMIDGLEFSRTLREQGKYLPFILLTGDEPNDAQLGFNAIDACLVKDFDLVGRLPQLIADTLAGAVHPT